MAFPLLALVGRGLGATAGRKIVAKKVAKKAAKGIAKSLVKEPKPTSTEETPNNATPQKEASPIKTTEIIPKKNLNKDI